jgi:MFS family permease
MRRLYLDTNLQVILGAMGVSSIMPVLARLTVELKVPAGSIGLVLTVLALPRLVLAPIAGVLADRVGCKKVLVTSLVILGSFGSACGFTDSFETLLPLRFLQGLGLAPMGVLSATVIGDLYEGEERITDMGYVAQSWAWAPLCFLSLVEHWP